MVLVAAVVAGIADAQSWRLSSTAYCEAGRTASGEQTYLGEAANNMLPLGTRIEINPAAFGRTRFVVLDRIGSGSQLDLFNPSCAAAIQFGRRTERVTVITRG